MKNNYINHFTFNTGHNRQSFPAEIDPKALEVLLQFINRVKNTGEKIKFEFIENSLIHITVEDNDMYAVTLYITKDGVDFPVLMTTGTSNPDKIDQLVEDTYAARVLCMANKIQEIPDPPVIIDYIFPSMTEFLDVAELTGDLSRCLAWAILDPESILNREV